MKKAIVVIRTSTERQEIEAQKAEICAFAASFGYESKNLIVIGDRGASAIKMNDLYLKNMELIRSTIESDPSVDCVFAWSLDRLARKDYLLLEFKNFVVSHHVNLRVKVPNFSLLNDDGTVNPAMEVAISMFATLGQQEMELKKERFMRAKKANSAQGKFIGARYMLYGYTTNPEGYLIINPDEAAIVRLIFKMYLTKKYSTPDLAKELNERGYKFRDRKFTEGRIINILKNTAYIGYLDRNTLFTKYPAIVTEDQFKQVEEIRKSRNNNIKKSPEIHLATKILKCIDCGSYYFHCQNTKEAKYYCYKNKQKRRFEPDEACTTSCGISAPTMDKILTDLAINLHHNNMSSLTDAKVKELKENKAILLQKIDTILEEIEATDGKFTKVLDAYTDDIITKDQYKSRIDHLKSEKSNLKLTIEVYNKELDQINKFLKENDLSEAEKIARMVERMEKGNEVENDPSKIKPIIDKYIKVAYCKVIKVGTSDYTLIIVIDFEGNIYNYLFKHHHHKYTGLYRYSKGQIKVYSQIKSISVLGVTKITNKPNNLELIKKINSDPVLSRQLKDQVDKYNQIAKSRL